MFNFNSGELKVFLVHPGGSYWHSKQFECWSIPKGEFEDNEEPLNAAKREFREETSFYLAQDENEFIPLSPISQKSGKIVYAFAIEDDIDVRLVASNKIQIEFPPHSGKKIWIPEVDKGEFFTVEDAKLRLNPAQIPLIDELILKLN